MSGSAKPQKVAILGGGMGGLATAYEMTNQPGIDYMVLTTYQPDEPPLQMTANHLHELRRALDEIGDRPELRAYPDFILYPVDR